MQLETSSRLVSGVLVLDCRGRIVFGDETAFLRHQVRDLLNESQTIVLNLADVNYIDSAGLGTLVGLHASAKKVGAKVELAGLMGKVKDLLQITKLLTVFQTFPTVNEAVAHVSGEAQARTAAKSGD